MNEINAHLQCKYYELFILLGLSTLGIIYKCYALESFLVSKILMQDPYRFATEAFFKPYSKVVVFVATEKKNKSRY